MKTLKGVKVSAPSRNDIDTERGVKGERGNERDKENERM